MGNALRKGWILFLAAGLANAGNESSGGDDNLSADAGSIWFLGDAPIRSCLEVDAKFGVAEGEIIQKVERAFGQWASYVLRKGVHRDQKSLKDGLYHARSLELRAGCRGTEELKIYFGVLNEEIRKAKEHFTNPSAFVWRSSYDPNAGRAKGFIWIAPPASVFPEESFPNWNLPHALDGILLHELGHVMGVGHIQNTVMTAGFGSRLPRSNREDADGAVRKQMTNIDWEEEVIETQDRFASSINGVFATEADHADRLRFLFRELFGREPRGIIRARFETASTQSEFRLIVSDDRREEVLTMRGAPEPVRRETLFLAYNEKGSHELSRKAIMVHAAEHKGPKKLTGIFVINRNSPPTFAGLQGPALIRWYRPGEEGLYYKNDVIFSAPFLCGTLGCSNQ